jgi:hypothetical protein
MTTTRLAEALAEYDRYPGVAAERLAEAVRVGMDELAALETQVAEAWSALASLEIAHDYVSDGRTLAAVIADLGAQIAAPVASADAGREGAIVAERKVIAVHLRDSAVDPEATAGERVVLLSQADCIERGAYYPPSSQPEAPKPSSIVAKTTHSITREVMWTRPEAPKPAEVEQAGQPGDWRDNEEGGPESARFYDDHPPYDDEDREWNEAAYVDDDGWRAYDLDTEIASGPETGPLGQCLADLTLCSRGFLAWERIAWGEDVDVEGSAAGRQWTAAVATLGGTRERLTPATLDAVLAAVRETQGGAR